MRPFGAVLLREFRAASVNRYLMVFAALALVGGFAAVRLSEAPDAAGFLMLQLALYLVSLFSLLVGVSSARAEAEEWPLLFAQPLSRSASVFGKFAATAGIFAGLLALLFAPAFIAGHGALVIAQLYGTSVVLAAVFASFGLCAGLWARDRVQGLVAAVSVWLLLLVGVDLVALIAAHWPLLQKAPDLWVALLMLNPLDAFRIEALFSMEQVPTEAANKTALAGWWLAHARLWFYLLSGFWTAAALFVSRARLENSEI